MYCYTISDGYGGETQEEIDAQFRAQNPEAMAANDARLATSAAASGPATTTGNSTSSETVEKACEHKYVSEIKKEPTETEEGEITYTCYLCGDTYTEAIPVKGSEDYIVEVTKESTCTETGETTYICENYSYTEEILSFEHIPGEWEVTVPAVQDGSLMENKCKMYRLR